MKQRRKFLSRPLTTVGAAAAIALASTLAAAVPAIAASIINDWSTVQVPPPPKLEPVTINPKTTALLVLDIVKQLCNEKAPRCLATVPQVAKLLQEARANHMLVVYTLFLGPDQIGDVLPDVKPTGSEPVLRAVPDKFIGTDLEKILKAHHITTVIPVGTVANGAILYTASHAAQLGFNVVLPVDGMSSQSTYAEQYVAWNMANAPVIPLHVKLTAVDQMKF
ncbi:MAG TPA: cysteine hydrolase [Stellaceae bacterium]|jgi:nicotinamidase-related amidase